jgi:hypothetical protein
MKILGLLRADAASEAGELGDPDLFARMGAFMEEVTKAGILKDTDGLKPSSFGKRVKLGDGKVSVIDGPFTESKELVASYALFEVKSMDEAVHWTTRFLEVIGEGECELRPIYELSDFPADVMPPHLVEQEEAIREQMAKNAGKQ